MVDAQVKLAEDLLAVIAHRYVFHIDDRRRQFFGFGEGKDHARRIFGSGDFNHFVEHLHTRLRLFRFGRLRLEPIHKGLQVFALQVLFLGGGDDHGAFGGARFGEIVVAARIKRQFFAFQMQNRTHSTVQKRTIVRNQQHSVRIFAKVSLKPQCALKVEVVGRLVE